MYINLHIWV